MGKVLRRRIWKESTAEVVLETNQGNEEFKQEYWESPYHKERSVRSKGKGL